MALQIQTNVGPMDLADGVQSSGIRQGHEGQLIVAGLHGRYYEQAKRGNVFWQMTTPLGLAVPLYTATAPVLLLWNPSGSGKNAVLVRYSAQYASGTTVGGNIGLSRIANAGAQVATGSPITAFTATTPWNGIIGGGNVSKMLSAASGTITVVAGVAADFFYTMFSEFAAIATSAITPVGSLIHDFEGAVIIPPGAAVWPSASLASGALLAQLLMWEEVDA